MALNPSQMARKSLLAVQLMAAYSCSENTLLSPHCCLCVCSVRACLHCRMMYLGAALSCDQLDVCCVHCFVKGVLGM
jgi:hypothetical protein